MPRLKQNRSVPFDVYRWSDYPELNQCLDQLTREIVAWERAERGRKRCRTPSELDDLRTSIRLLVLNLYVAWRHDPLRTVGVSRDMSKFASTTRYARLFLRHRAFLPALDGLIIRGYVEVVRRGFFDRKSARGETTKVRATDQLIKLLTGPGRLSEPCIRRHTNEEIIILKDSNKKLIEYIDTEQTIVMRKNLERINEVLSRCWIDIEMTDKDYETLKTKLAQDPDREAFDLTSRRLRRIFNEGNFQTGGRFYGGWWQQVPRDYRRFITINDKPTVELDYSGLHPAMLYAMRGLTPPTDPYDIGVDPKHRNHVKKALNALLNAEGRIQPLPKPDLEAMGLTWNELKVKLFEKHKPIADRLGSGAWRWLQYRDSQIAEHVLLHFAKQDIPCLPLHDSFIMHHGYERELKTVMANAYKETMGHPIPIKLKWTIFDDRRQESKAMVKNLIIPDDLDILLKSREPYSSYDQRITEWRRIKTSE